MSLAMPSSPGSLSVVILGCGRVGSSLARQMAREGHSITIIDLTSDAFRRLGQKFKGQRVVGTGLDQDTLRKAGLDRADVFVAVTQGDNTNIMAAQIAREVFSVGKVVARIYDAKRAAVYERLGIPTVATVPWSTDRLMRMLLPDGVASAWREPTGTVAILPLPVNEDWVGRRIAMPSPA